MLPQARRRAPQARLFSPASCTHCFHAACRSSFPASGSSNTCGRLAACTACSIACEAARRRQGAPPLCRSTQRRSSRRAGACTAVAGRVPAGRTQQRASSARLRQRRSTQRPNIDPRSRRHIDSQGGCEAPALRHHAARTLTECTVCSSSASACVATLIAICGVGGDGERACPQLASHRSPPQARPQRSAAARRHKMAPLGALCARAVTPAPAPTLRLHRGLRPSTGGALGSPQGT